MSYTLHETGHELGHELGEWEDELTGEGAFEDEYGGEIGHEAGHAMAHELSHELGHELAHELTHETESGEGFLGNIISGISSLLGETEDEFGFSPESGHELGHEFAGEFGQEGFFEQEGFLGNIISGISSLLGETEDEGAFEDEFGGELGMETGLHEGFFEDEGAFEDEWGYGFGYESAHETGHEFHPEFGHELSAEAIHEADRFFGSLVRAAAPALKNLAGQAARAALAGGMSAAPLPAFALRLAANALRETEIAHEIGHELAHEGGYEFGEGSHELNPTRRVYADAMMEHLAASANEASGEWEDEGEGFLPLIPLALKAIPLALKAGKALKFGAKLAPKLMKGVKGVAKFLGKSKKLRNFRRLLPRISRQTVNQISQIAKRGGNVTPQRALNLLARNTARTIGNPRQAAQAYRRSRAVAARFPQLRRAMMLRRRRRFGGYAAPTTMGPTQGPLYGPAPAMGGGPMMGGGSVAPSTVYGPAPAAPTMATGPQTVYGPAPTYGPRRRRRPRSFLLRCTPHVCPRCGGA